MMSADLEDLLLVSRLCPELKWSSSVARRVVVSRDGNVLRLYWMPVLLLLDEFLVAEFIQELNGQRRGLESATRKK